MSIVARIRVWFGMKKSLVDSNARTPAGTILSDSHASLSTLPPLVQLFGEMTVGEDEQKFRKHLHRIGEESCDERIKKLLRLSKVELKKQILYAVCIGRKAHASRIEHVIESTGLRPATIHELAYAEITFPEVQSMSGRLIAFGTVYTTPISHNRRVPFLRTVRGVRRMGLKWRQHSWREDDLFLAAKEIPLCIS